MGNAPWFSLAATDDLVTIQAAGTWTVDSAAEIEEALNALTKELSQAARISIDLGKVDEFDTFGVWLVERLRRELNSLGIDVELKRMNKQAQPLFREIEGLNHEPPGSSMNDQNKNWFTMDSPAITQLAGDIHAYTAVFGATVGGFLKTMVRPDSFRLTSFAHQFDRVAWQALTIVFLVTFIIGAIIAQQGFFHFRRFGADLYVIDMVGFLVMREIGVLLVAIVVAGRSGSSFTAELGSMKMREEIDALNTMGLNPIEVLILPRVLVLIVAMPILAFVGSMSALFGAGIVAVFYEGLSPALFTDRLKDAISIDHFLVGMIKAPFIGAVIGVISCTEGLRVQGSTTSLGVHTTRSVVTSIFMVVVLDALFAIFFTAIEM